MVVNNHVIYAINHQVKAMKELLFSLSNFYLVILRFVHPEKDNRSVPVCIKIHCFLKKKCGEVRNSSHLA